MKVTLLRKIASVMVAVALVGLTAGPVAAQTVEQMLAQIAALQAQLAALQGATPPAAPTAAFTFTRNLQLGVRGDDVRALQEYLRGTGHFPAGQAATGFFGPLTRTAVAAWQAANGVTPAAGFWGPRSIARYNALMAAVPTPTPTPPPGVTPTPTPTPPVTGAEGSFRNVRQLTDVSNAVLREGQENVRVIGVEFGAAGSDLRVARVDVLFAHSGTGSNRPWRYFNEVSLFSGTTRLASQTVTSSGAWSDEGVISGFGPAGTATAYRISFSGLNEVVRQGSTAHFNVAVSVQGTVDTANLGAVWNVRIPVNGIRAVDGAGINQFAPGTVIDDRASFTGVVTGALVLGSDSALNRARVAEVHAINDTNNVEVANFTLRARDGDVRVTRMQIPLLETFAGTTASPLMEGVRRFTLLRNASPIRTVAAPAAGTTVDFTDLNFTIPAGSTDSFVLRADMRNVSTVTGAVFQPGNTLQMATLPPGNITAEDPVRGTAIIPSGSATGGLLSFFAEGIRTAVLERSVTRTASTGAGVPDRATFAVRFSVTAFGNEIWIPRAVRLDDAILAPAAAFGVQADIMGADLHTSLPAAIGTMQGAATAALTSNAHSGTHAFRVAEGETREFTLNVAATATGTAVFALLGLESIGFNVGATGDVGTSASILSAGIDGNADWRTGVVELRP